MCVLCLHYVCASSWLRVKLKLSSRMLWSHMWGGKDIAAALILNFGIRWRWAVNFTLQSLYPRVRTQEHIEQQAAWAPQLVYMFGKRWILASVGILTLDCPVCSTIAILSLLSQLILHMWLSIVIQLQVIQMRLCLSFVWHSLPCDRSIDSSKASSSWSVIYCFLFNFQHFLFSLRSSSSCLCLLHCLSVPSIFPAITCFRRQFPCKMWPIQLAFLFIVHRIFLSFTLHFT
jgi:hypothetical protein